MNEVKLIIPENPSLDNRAMIDVSALGRKYLDVPYASIAPSQKLDLYLPDEGDGPFPLIVFIHGGAFIRGDKRDFQAMIIIDALNRGFAIASVEYRFAPETLFPYQLFDVKAAVRWLRAHAGEYYLDGDRFIAAGTSCGAYFAAMLAATNGAAQFEERSLGNPGVSSAVQGLMGFYGLYNLVRQSEYTQEQGPLPGMDEVFNFADIFAGVSAREHPNLMYLASPVNLVTGDMPPTLIQGGNPDGIVPYEDSVEMAEKIKTVCGAERIQFDTLDGAFHGDAAYGSPENQARIFAFLERNFLKGAEGRP
ncbi:MAG: alpha/beta hydrolase [Oscillospiraceae bacterium]|jgi:acetyl esterase/lipase|nr:alpha/beta hydrolase [Oscillospiraceae bacterium]